MLSYIITSQPWQFTRFINYYLLWQLLHLGLLLRTNLMAIILYPFNNLSLLLASLMVSHAFSMNNFSILLENQLPAFRINARLSLNMPSLNAIMHILYAKNRCQSSEISMKLESIEMSDNSEFIKQIVIIIIHLVVYQVLSLVILSAMTSRGILIRNLIKNLDRKTYKFRKDKND